MGDEPDDAAPTGLAPTELGAVIDETEAVTAWSLDDGEEWEPPRLTPGRIVAIAVGASAVVIAAAGGVAVSHLRNSEPAPAVVAAPTPTTTTTTVPPPPPPPPPVTITSTVQVPPEPAVAQTVEPPPSVLPVRPPLQVDGAGHQWPGSTPIGSGADTPSQALNATSTLWQFFAGHPPVNR
jgi:hypothetical protein